MPEANSPVEVVCAIIRDAAGRLLAAQRPVGKALAGCWEFPGGKTEPGESPQAALVREIAEELGCGIRVSEALPPVEHAYPRGTIVLRPFVAEVCSGEPFAHEHAALRWVTAAEAAELTWAPADVPILHGLGISTLPAGRNAGPA